MSKNQCGLDYCPYADLVGEFANCTACSWAIYEDEDEDESEEDSEA